MKKYFKNILNLSKRKKETGHDDLKKFELQDLTAINDEDAYIRFARNFINKGGRFLYVDSLNDEMRFIRQIMLENNNKLIWACEDFIQKLVFQATHSVTTINPQPSYQINFISCEYLLAHNGSIMISSDQTNKRKITELANRFVIFATTNQIVESVSDGLKKIKHLKSHSLPTNITTLQPGYDRLIYLILIENQL